MIKINKKDLDLRSTLLSGQCFRVFEEDNKFINILKDRVVLMWEEKDHLCAESDNYENLENILLEYFDLNTDYEMINRELSDKDKYMNKIIPKCRGYKILKQDHFEMYLSFIISQNNNVKRIGGTVEKLSRKYGKKVIFKDHEYYLFPSFDSLCNIKIDDIKEMGLGYRDKYIINALEYLKTNTDLFRKLTDMSDEEAINELMKINGIGLKVASCILLFGFHKLGVYPIDRWVKKNISINYKYLINDYNNIMKFARRNYGKYCGVAIQYMFHSERNVK